MTTWRTLQWTAFNWIPFLLLKTRTKIEKFLLSNLIIQSKCHFGKKETFNDIDGCFFSCYLRLSLMASLWVDIMKAWMIITILRVSTPGWWLQQPEAQKLVSCSLIKSILSSSHKKIFFLFIGPDGYMQVNLSQFCIHRNMSNLVDCS